MTVPKAENISTSIKVTAFYPKEVLEEKLAPRMDRRPSILAFHLTYSGNADCKDKWSVV